MFNAIKTVADASLKRMDEYHGALVFWYPKGDYISRAYKEHYSGLTQSRYLVQIYRAYEITGEEKYKEAAEKVFESLLVPVELGGVFYEWDGGIAIEEFPGQPNEFILNGWLSILENLYQYATLSGDQRAFDIHDKSADSLSRILQLYDYESAANSRYSLAGFTYLRLLFSPSSQGVEVQNIMIDIPEDGRYELEPGDTSAKSRWEKYLFQQDVESGETGLRLNNNAIRMNVVLSRISYPESNYLLVELHSESEVDFTLQGYLGEYDPLWSSPINLSWEDVYHGKLDKGANSLRIPLQWESFDLIGYPTNFNKEINGENFNVYHFIHIDKLRKLYENTGYTLLVEYADMWEEYAERWPSMDLYEGLMHTQPYK